MWTWSNPCQSTTCSHDAHIATFNVWSKKNNSTSNVDGRHTYNTSLRFCLTHSWQPTESVTKQSISWLPIIVLNQSIDFKSFLFLINQLTSNHCTASIYYYQWRSRNTSELSATSSKLNKHNWSHCLTRHTKNKTWTRERRQARNSIVRIRWRWFLSGTW